MTEKQHDIEDFKELKWPDLEAMSNGTCPCCNEGYNQNQRPEITGLCHTGAVFASYWDGWLYFECGKCRKPLCKVPVGKSML